MQFLITAISVIGGMAFSLAFAIMVEEFIFGKVLVVLFARRAVRVEAAAAALGHEGDPMLFLKLLLTWRPR